jgi:hypothetical protein
MLKHSPQWLQIGFSNSLVSFFEALGPTLRPSSSSAFIHNLGQIEKIFSISALTVGCCKALAADFNFCTNRNA